MNLDKLKLAYDYISKVDPDLFRLDSWATKTEACGTIACASGHLYLSELPEFRVKQDLQVGPISFDHTGSLVNFDGYEYAVRLLECGRWAAEWLFGPPFSIEGNVWFRGSHLRAWRFRALMILVATRTITVEQFKSEGGLGLLADYLKYLDAHDRWECRDVAEACWDEVEFFFQEEPGHEMDSCMSVEEINELCEATRS